MKFLMQTFGWVLVLLGAAAPPALLYLYYQYPDEVEAYRSTYQSFGSLEKDEQQRAIEELDFQIAARKRANQELERMQVEDVVRSLNEGRAQ